VAEKIGIIAFAFGVPSSIPSNRTITHIAGLESYYGFCVPVYTQRDIQICQDKFGVGRIEYTKEKPGNPPPILRIARGAIQWAKERELSSLVIVAAAPHLWRALRDTKYAVREAGLQIKVLPSELIQKHSKNFWFCSESTQKRTTSWWQWWSREIIVKLMPFWLYKRIAS